MVSNMNYAIIENFVVVNTAVSSRPLAANWVPAPDGVGIGWTYSKAGFAPPVAPEPSPEELKETFRRAVQAHIDTTAQARMYDSGASLAGYVNSAVPAWAAEAQAFVAWRDAVWLFVFNRLAQVEAGEVAPPASAQELIDMLPVIAWP